MLREDFEVLGSFGCVRLMRSVLEETRSEAVDTALG